MAANLDPAIDQYSSADVTMITDHHIMLDQSSAIEDAVITDAAPSIDDDPMAYGCALSESRMAADVSMA